MCATDGLGCATFTVVVGKSFVNKSNFKKRQDVELLRILSAFGIVWFHTPSIMGKNVAYSGLIVFIIISMYFSTKSKLKSKTLLEKFNRIFIPWFFWMVFYGLINIVVNKPFIPTNNGIISGILVGSSIHLWYIPYIFMMSTIFNPVKYINSEITSYLCILFIIFIFYTSQSWSPWAFDSGYPLVQYAHSLGAVVIGVFLANCSVMSRWLAVGLVCFILAIINIFTTPESMAVPYSIGIVLTTLVFFSDCHFSFKEKVNELSECTFGIYLLHPFWLKIIKQIGFTFELSIPILAFSLSTITVLYLKKTLPNIAKYIV